MEVNGEMASKEINHQEPDKGLELAENVLANDSSENSFNTAEDADASSCSIEEAEVPVKFDFHLPDDIWEIILNKLTEDVDRINCCKALPLFDSLLTKSKQVWMFKQILPFVHPFLGEKDKLTCRRICTQWYADIDPFITPGKQDWNSFNSVKKIDSFIQTLDDPSWNPFIARTVCIANDVDDGAAEYLHKLFTLLSKCGMHVWILDFRWSSPFRASEDHRLVDSYMCLLQVLTKTPNLRHLVFFGSCALHSGFGSDDDYRARSLSITKNPLPAVPSLESLNAVCLSWDGFPYSLINALVLPYALHLKTIETEWRSCDQAFSHQLLKLTHLVLRGVPDNQGLKKLLRLTAPLKKVEIEFKSFTLHQLKDKIPLISIRKLLRVFHHFPFLDEVAVWNIYGVKTKVDLSRFSVSQNSTVRKLTLQFLDGSERCRHNQSGCFNFLQVFTALQHLSVKLDYNPKEIYLKRNEWEREVDFYKMLEEGQLYEFNIWKLIPSLKTVHISGGQHFGSVSGNRKGLEKYQVGNRLNSIY